MDERIEEPGRTFRETRRFREREVEGSCGRCGEHTSLAGELLEGRTDSANRRRVMMLCDACFEYYRGALR